MGPLALSRYKNLTLPFAIEVEGFLDFLLCSCLVDADVADVAQEGEVDGGADVLLVVVHQLHESRGQVLIPKAKEGWTKRPPLSFVSIR